MREKICCVYKIKNLKNGKVYIGQSVHYLRRVTEHLVSLRNNEHCNKFLQEDYNLYGERAFEFSIIERCSEESLLELETKYMNYYGGIESSVLYNECDLLGHNNVYRQNQSKAQLGVHTISKEGKLRISQAHKGKTLTEEQKEKIRENAKINKDYGMKNKRHSENAKAKMREAKQNMYLGSNNPNYKYTPEFINQLRQEYNDCHNYAELGRRHNIARTTISSLIRLGHC